MDPSEIRKKIGRFRILVIGRANAGKTTILQRVCNTRENPEIFNSAGKKIDATVLIASTERGEHDIENEMVFRNNPGFIFHDSRGFEAGGESEFDKVKAFIVSRCKEARLKDQLHAIWYCIPMDEASRSFTEGEIKFFSQCDTGSIPVIVLFTKFDALYDLAYSELKSKGASMEDAEEQAPKHAEESFAKGSQLKFLYHSKDIRHPPKCHVCLPNMDNDDANCGPLIERTAGTLNSEVLTQLFVSTQQTNLELCMKYAVERILPTFFDSVATPDGYQELIRKLGTWFPHLWEHRYWRVDYAYNELGIDVWKVSVLILHRARVLLMTEIACPLTDRSYFIHPSLTSGHADRRCYTFAGCECINPQQRWMIFEVPSCFDQLSLEHCEELRSRILSVASGSSPLENIVQLSSAVVIIFEHSFYIYDKRRHLQDQQKSAPSYNVALELYMASPHAATVRETVRAAVQAYEEAMRAPVPTYKGNLPAWMTKLLFERSEEKKKMAKESMAKAELLKTVLEITLEHRLPRP